MRSEDALSHFLRRRRLYAGASGLVWSAFAALAALVLTLAERLGWAAWGEEAAWVSIAAALLVLGWWIRRGRRLRAAIIARELDERWQLLSRLESAVELSADASVWAAAQRADAAARIEGRPPPGGVLWRVGLRMLAATLVLAGFEAGVLAWRAMEGPPASKPAIQTLPPGATAGPKALTSPFGSGTPLPIPSRRTEASIVWKSPIEQIKATAIEEVPLVATATSPAGFRAVSLRITVNGGPETVLPLDAASLAASAKPGEHELAPSLFLDELKVREFDVIAYHLVGELNGEGQKGPVSSTLQFIQVRQPQVEMVQAGSGDGKLISLIFGLKALQLQLLKENFALDHLTAKGDPGWKRENSRVAGEQGGLAGKAGDARDFARSESAPEPLLGYLAQAQSAMKSAGRQIAGENNAGAARSQNEALALLAECEQFFHKALNVSTTVADPFKDDQAFALEARSETLAGAVETIARRQARNNELAERADAIEQAAIASESARLAADGALEADIQTLLKQGAAAAAKEADQLAVGDRPAAREPAAAAQRMFERAVAAQEQRGRAGAVALLDDVRRSLNEAARTEDSSARAAKLAGARATVRAAAALQQKGGSADAARELGALVRTMTGSASIESARIAADAATRSQVILLSRETALNRAVRRLNWIARAGAPGGRAIDRDALADLELSSQEAEWATSQEKAVALARRAAGQASASLHAATPDPLETAAAVDAAVRLAAALEALRNVGTRDEFVRRFKPDDIDPLYRAAVEEYFERLSRQVGFLPSADSR